MLKSFLLMAIISLCTFSTIAQNFTKTNFLIDYEPKSTVFHAETQEILQSILERVQESEQIDKIELIAYADNRDLSEERIDTITNFLAEQFISSEQLEKTTEFSDLHQVHIIIYSKLKEARSLAKNDTNQLEEELVPKRYCAGASKAAQVFEIAAPNDIDIKGKEGTKLQIEREDLVHQNGEAVEGAIKVELKEFYTSADILLADLHTMDGDEVLETGGMLHLNITAEGKPLVLKKNRSAKIQMPTKTAKNKQGMDLYFGKPKLDGAVDWKVEKSNTVSTTIVDSKAFSTDSYVRLKKKEVIDSISYINFRDKKSKNSITGNEPMTRRKIIKHSHEEEYFDLELPYIPTPPPPKKRVTINPGRIGFWINIDRRFRIGIDIQLPSIKINPPPPPSVDILVQVNGVPIQGISRDGNLVATSPRVALMLKDRAVFLSGKFLPTGAEIGCLKLNFERVPLNQEAVLVAFLDVGEEILFATQELNTEKGIDLQQLELKPIAKSAFQAKMSAL